MDYLGIAGFIISIISLVFAIFIYLKHDKRIKSQELLINEYQLRKHQEEDSDNKKAMVRANLIKDLRGLRKLRVYNSGKSIARNIRFDIIDLDSNDATIRIGKNPFPYEFMNSQDSTEISFLMSYGHPEKITVTLIWDDDFKKNNETTQVFAL